MFTLLKNKLERKLTFHASSKASINGKRRRVRDISNLLNVFQLVSHKPFQWLPVYR